MRTGPRGWPAAALLSLLISLAIVSPFFKLGNATGHDFQYHAESWLDAAGQWKQGVLYPRWTQWSNYGYGEPRFIFYPPLSWMLGGALGLALPWNYVPAVFILLVQVFAGLSAFALARRLVETNASALFGAACYAANPYALLIIYWRSDFAELLADAFFPLLVLLALDVCGGALLAQPTSEKQASTTRVAAFACVFAAMWLSNAPAGVIASYSVAALLGFAALKNKSWEPLLRGGSGLLLGFALTAFYLLPAAYEQRWVNIGQALSAGLLPSENFLYTETLDPEHTVFNWIASTLAVVMIALAGFAAVAAHRRGATAVDDPVPAPGSSSLWQVMVLFWVGATFLMLRFSSALWMLLPKLKFVQFPWRWMSLLAIPFAICLAWALHGKWRGWIWIVITVSSLLASGVALVKTGWWDTADIPDLQQSLASGSGWDGTDEYDPIGDDHTNIPTKSPIVKVMDTDTMPGPNKQPTIRVAHWSPEEKEVTVSAPLPFYLGLRLLNYPAWRCAVNGQEVTPHGGEDYNEMIVPLPAGESHVRVRFVRTWDRFVGGFISVAALLLTLLLALRKEPR